MKFLRREYFDHLQKPPRADFRNPYIKYLGLRSVIIKERLTQEVYEAGDRICM